MIKSDQTGTPVVVGSVTVILPKKGVPETDDDVIEWEELIADVEHAMEPAAEVVKTAKELVKQLRDGISTRFRLRAAEAADPTPQMFVEPEETKSKRKKRVTA